MEALLAQIRHLVLDAFDSMMSLILIVLAAGSLFLISLSLRRRKLPLPPGPKGWPVIGNALDLPTSHPGQVYHQLCRDQDSDIIHLRALGSDIIILDSAEANADILEKRSAVSSSRPDQTMIMDSRLMACDWDVVLTPYGDIWKSRRRLFHETFHEQATKAFRPNIQSAVSNLLRRLLTSPSRFPHHLAQYSAEVVVSVAYGLEVAEENDPLVQSIDKLMDDFCRCMVPGKYLVDILPILKYVPSWFPGAGFKRTAHTFREDAFHCYNPPIEAVKERRARGDARNSFLDLQFARMAEKKHKFIDDKVIYDVVSTMYAAGVETSTSLFHSFVFAMLIFPEIQRKAQAELDRALPPGTFPSIDDEESFPYLTAVILELLRWAPVVPYGVPHRLTEEVIYRGYRLPKDSTVVQNIFGIFRDENIYPKSDRFDPERFLRDGKVKPMEQYEDPRNIAFGAGRRICPGKHLGWTSIWTVTATILTAFDISDAPGSPRPSELDFNEVSLIRRPLPFNCKFTPRSEKVANAIRGLGD